MRIRAWLVSKFRLGPTQILFRYFGKIHPNFAKLLGRNDLCKAPSQQQNFFESFERALWQVSRGDRGPDSGAREGGTQACHGEVRSANWTPGRHAERHVSPHGSSTVSGYGSVDPGSADRWRNTKLSRKYAPFVLARWAAQLSKNFGRKSGPPKFR